MVGYLSEADAQKYTTLSRQVLLDARTDGKLTYRQMGRRILYTTEDLDRFVQRNSKLKMCTEDMFFVSNKKGAL